jgi:hypothetical protein
LQGLREWVRKAYGPNDDSEEFVDSDDSDDSDDGDDGGAPGRAI